jgi:hypothetical protein
LAVAINNNKAITSSVKIISLFSSSRKSMLIGALYEQPTRRRLESECDRALAFCPLITEMSFELFVKYTFAA